MLSDSAIRRLIAAGVVQGTNEDAVQAASLDCHLSGNIRVEPYTEVVESIGGDESTFVTPVKLAATRESFWLPPHIGVWVSGCSTLARMGLQIHSAGWVDPGFGGQVTLEIVNFGPTAVSIGMDEVICQVLFELVTDEHGNVVAADKPYNGRYQGQTGPTGPRPPRVRS